MIVCFNLMISPECNVFVCVCVCHFVCSFCVFLLFMLPVFGDVYDTTLPNNIEKRSFMYDLSDAAAPSTMLLAIFLV